MNMTQKIVKEFELLGFKNVKMVNGNLTFTSGEDTYNWKIKDAESFLASANAY